jgi:hypothetical protein
MFYIFLIFSNSACKAASSSFVQSGYGANLVFHSSCQCLSSYSSPLYNPVFDIHLGRYICFMSSHIIYRIFKIWFSIFFSSSQGMIGRPPIVHPRWAYLLGVFMTHCVDEPNRKSSSACKFSVNRDSTWCQRRSNEANCNLLENSTGSR